MSISKNDFQIERLNSFWNFVFERQKIWQRRFVEKKEPPWTDDPTMQKERFTNIYRELDPGTQYAIKNILETNASKEDKIFNIMIYRLIGSSETHSSIGFQKLTSFSAKVFEKQLKTIRNRGKPVFTAAYTVSGYSKMGSKDKIENVTKIFENLQKNFEMFYAQIEKSSNSEEVYNAIRSQSGFGNFLAYQVLVDLLYPLKIYGNGPSISFSRDDWAAAGPGARKGIILLILKESTASSLDVMQWLRDNQISEFKRLNLKFPFLKKENGENILISLANIQNCLCEFYKYFKIRNGEGRGKKKFIPKTPSNFYVSI